MILHYIFDFFCLPQKLNFGHPGLPPPTAPKKRKFLRPFSSKQDMKNEFYSLVSDDWIGDGDGIGRPVRRVRRRARTTFGKLLLFLS
jgi:hypothetical protein